MEELMKCGHVAMAHSDDGKPYCIICDCGELADEKPDLEGRKSKCSYCGHITDSKWTLPFFEYREGKDTDKHYCGCCGWD